MKHGHKLSHPAALEMPAGFDPSGIPCADTEYVESPVEPISSSTRPALPGISETSYIASVEEVVPQECGDWLVWGSVGSRPVLFSLDASSATEMMSSVHAGEAPTAIIEPWQLVLERLD
ncbi:MAG TPA: hypothetical protein VIV06_10745 [Candidatus Limnocylindrales bacterium]